ncbi:GNAT family N-acetyltransferase [Dokdonella immobilis]|uniref:Ribosomal protein S18 acetylase RimI n=1 Tax=Dokdonella immobilis TaxID=578942 RepID=A0A1I4ZRF3_9GAMM|nr:GNAT family N-acetyltransferase [Dokdonella immobilis]SFN52841.1 Ribosomal protein S18 acetylase RimI [Dokdonella immobilis]
MNPAIMVRAATTADIPFLVECNAAMALETEHKTLDRGLLERGTRAVFEEPRRGFYRVAERAGEAIGSLMVTYEWSDWRNGDWWWIQSVYVTPPARRSGVFSALYADVEQQARAAPGVVGLRLYVENENTVALATYAALGMSDAGYRLLQAGFIAFDS